MLDQAFEALKTYNWGSERNVLNPINDAVIACQSDETIRQDLETRLTTALKTDLSRDAKDFVCRKLMQVGTAAAVPVLAELLLNPELSHMARFALERIPAPEAAQALREALTKVSGATKAGVLSSLGQRGDTTSVASIAQALKDEDPTVARAAALALGAIRTPEAAAALASSQVSNPLVQSAVVDASLSCAEGWLAAGNKGEALKIYKSYTAESHPKHVRLAATRGMLACAGK